MQEEENLTLTQVVEAENELKSFVVGYVGDVLKPEDGEVTVEMIVEVFAKDFPEFLMAIAEENFIRGYHQAFADIETDEKEQSETIDNKDE